MDTQLISDLFMIFNVSGDGSMSKQEFVFCWNGWIKKVNNFAGQFHKDNHFQCQIVRPRTAIIIVDVQNDFISGSLAISTCPAKQNGEEVIFTFETLFIKLGYSKVTG